MLTRVPPGTRRHSMLRFFRAIDRRVKSRLLARLNGRLRKFWIAVEPTALPQWLMACV
jgi:hypothetical protein